MKALILCHKTKDDLGSMKSVLEERGFTLDYILGYEDKLKDLDDSQYDLAVILGGPMGVYESAEHPYLLNEVEYIKSRIDKDLPTLGICLGAQLMANALGSRVYKAEQDKETGWRELDVTEKGLKSVVRHFDKSKTKMTQAHQDTFDFPKGATLLATSPQFENQIYSYGKNALGFQCHPEADEKIIDAWVNKHESFFLAGDMTKESVAEETQKYLPTLKAQTALFLNEWLDEVGFADA